MNGEDKKCNGWRRIGGRQRRIESPSKGRSTALHKQRGSEHEKSGWENPEAPVIHAGKRHVGRADHHGYQPVRQTYKRGHDRPKHHDQTVQCCHLIKEPRLNQLHTRLEKLGPDDHGEGAAKNKHGKREPQIHGANIFVVGGEQPAGNTLGRAVMMISHRYLSRLTLLVIDNIRGLYDIPRVVTKRVTLISNNGRHVDVA